MRIAILTSGRLPVPATNGGAVETKLDYTISYNNEHHLHNITVYSIKPTSPTSHLGDYVRYIHININSLFFKIGKKIYKMFNKKCYYDSGIEYFLHICIKHIKLEKYDAIIIANRPGYVEKIAKSTSTPLILQLNNDYINIDIHNSSMIKEKCSGIITCSQYINKRVSEVKCNMNIPIITVHNGIDIARFAYANPIERKKIGLNEDDYVIIYSGRVIKEKGVLELIRAIKNLNDLKNIRLLIVGASFYGKDVKQSSYIESLQTEANEIKEKVIFTGFIDYSDIPTYLKVANLAVLPSIWDEPFGLTILETMATGTPLITTRCGGIPEICEGAAVLIDRVNIIDNISKAIKYLYYHPDTAKELGKIAQEKSWAFDKEIFSKNYIKAVESIVKQNSCS